MLEHGEYTFSPSANAYIDRDLLPHETPTYLTSTLQACETTDLNIPPQPRLRLPTLSPTAWDLHGQNGYHGRTRPPSKET